MAHEATQSLAQRHTFWKIALAACACTWGASFFVVQDVTDQFPVFWFLAVRFGIATLVCLLVFGKQVRANLNRGHVLFGVWIGILGWAAYVFQTYGVTMTTAGKNAFLTATYCVMVPFIAWAGGLGAPRRNNVLGAVLCLVGLGFVALDNGLPLNTGDLFTLVCAVFFAVQMVEMSRRGGAFDTLAVSTWEFATISVLSFVASPIMGEQWPGVASFTPQVVGAILFLAVICTVVCFVVFNYAFKLIDPTTGGILSALESPSGVLFAALFASETLSPRVLFGFALIFCAIVLSQLGEK